jgi:hypothetical protein
MAPVPMPETTMNQYNGTVFWKNDIRITGQVFSVKPEAKTVGVQQRSNLQLRRRIFSANSRHHTAAGFLVDDVDHLPQDNTLPERNYLIS